MTAKEFLASKQGNKKKVEGWQPIATPELLEEYAALKVSSIEPKWIKINSEDDLPKRGTDCHFIYSFENEYGKQNEEHLGVYSELFGFTSYYDSEPYSINEVSHYMPITKPQPPKD